jgi:hypothetical protein
VRIVQGWPLSAFAFALACGGCADQSAPPVVAVPGSRDVPAAPRGLSVAIPTDCPGGAVPKEPVDYGVCHLELALARTGSSAKVNVAVATDPAAAAALTASGVQLGARSESYVILPEAQATQVIGRDPAGAMYGALDVAERLGQGGAGALPLHAPVVASPAVTVRAANPFLTVPTRGEPIWWFDDPKFWTEFLDMMARGRLNFLDMHGMYNPENTKCPNALLWFALVRDEPELPPARRAARAA